MCFIIKTYADNAKMCPIYVARELLDFRVRLVQGLMGVSISYGKLVTYIKDGRSLRNVWQIRRTEYPEYNLGNT